MNFAAPVFCAGAQLGTFEGRGPIPEKGHILTFQKNIRPVNIVFQIRKWRKYCGRFTCIVALKNNDSYCYFLSGQGKERGPGMKPQKISRNHAFYFREMPFLCRDGTTVRACLFI